MLGSEFLLLFFFNDTATTEIYTLSLHDALPILSLTSRERMSLSSTSQIGGFGGILVATSGYGPDAFDFARDKPIEARSEEHTSELQSRQYLVCRLLLEKKRTHETVSTETNQFIK